MLDDVFVVLLLGDLHLLAVPPFLVEFMLGVLQFAHHAGIVIPHFGVGLSQPVHFYVALTQLQLSFTDEAFSVC